MTLKQGRGVWGAGRGDFDEGRGAWDGGRGTSIRVSATAFAIPYRRPLVLASGTTTEHCGVEVEIADRDGHRGFGEIAPGPGTSLTAASALARRVGDCAEAIAELVPCVLQAPAKVRGIIPVELLPGIEAAALDLHGRRTGEALLQTLGRAPAHPSVIEVNAMIDRAAPDVVRRAIDDAIADGYRCLKIKVAPADLAAARDALHYLRERHGDAIAVRIDCNGTWSLAEARAALHELERFAIEYAEQPTATIEELRELRGATSIRIAADESAGDLAAIERAIDLGAVDLFVLKPARLGAIDSLRAARAARSAGIDCVVTSNLETSLGVACAVHIAAIVDALQPHRGYAHGLGTVGLLAGDIVATSLLPTAGTMEVPAGPGCGVSPVPLQLERWRISPPLTAVSS